MIIILGGIYFISTSLLCNYEIQLYLAFETVFFVNLSMHT